MTTENNHYIINEGNSTNSIKLSKEEVICLYAFMIAMIKNKIDGYSFANYVEGNICIFKRDDLWEVYEAARGFEFEKNTYKNCHEACIRAIKLLANDMESKEIILGTFFKSLSINFTDAELAEFVNYSEIMHSKEKIEERKQYRIRILTLYKEDKINGKSYFSEN